MGRPPGCDKIIVKKGPWTPEEDIILASYIQEHGPGNWRAIPTNTSLLRCSKSCRLRWTNYLRPGIRRGSFTENEEKTIIHLQALLGNRWAAIASYLPYRTDNDIKNYWNTHLKKRLHSHGRNGTSLNSHQPTISKGQWERRLQTDIHTAKQALFDALSIDKSECTSSSNDSKVFSVPNTTRPVNQTSLYASSTENIARLLEKWKNKSPKASSPSEGAMSFDCSYSDVSLEDHEAKVEVTRNFTTSEKTKLESEMPLSMLEEWLLDDTNIQGQNEDFMDLGLEDAANLF